MMPENANNPSPLALPAPPAGKKKPAWKTPCFLLALIAVLLCGWQWLETRQRLGEMQQELNRRLAAGDAGEQEARGARNALREQVDGLQARLGALDGRLNEFQAQAATLQGVLQEVARSREETTLLEVEQAITLAAQQLQLAGNAPVALLALQAADASLARLERPQYLPLRKAVAKDIERLRAVPFVDVSGLSLYLEQVVVAADKLPLASAARLRAPAPGADAVAAEKSPWWQRIGGGAWQEIKGLIRIQRFDREAPALLAPGQEFFLRENLRLHLLNARVALLARDQATYAGELKVVQGTLSRYFDEQDPAVQGALASLRQAAGARLNVALPGLEDSLAALRSVRGAKEKR